MDQPARKSSMSGNQPDPGAEFPPETWADLVKAVRECLSQIEAIENSDAPMEAKRNTAKPLFEKAIHWYQEWLESEAAFGDMQQKLDLASKVTGPLESLRSLARDCFGLALSIPEPAAQAMEPRAERDFHLAEVREAQVKNVWGELRLPSLAREKATARNAARLPVRLT